MYRWACIPLKAVTKVKLYLHRSLCSLENSGHLNSSENSEEYFGERKGSVQQWIWCRVPRAAHCRESAGKAPVALLPSARSGKHMTEPFPMFSLRKSSTNNMTSSFTQHPHSVFEGQRIGCVFYFTNDDRRIQGMWANIVMPAFWGVLWFRES